MIIGLEPCRECREDCFAYKDGACTALNDTRFGNGCVFYATKDQRETARKNVKKRLLDLDMAGLYYQYNKD